MGSGRFGIFASMEESLCRKGQGSYDQMLDRVLDRSAPKVYSALDLFAGCGGQSLGFEAAGFSTLGYEMDRAASATYSRNLLGCCRHEKIGEETCFPVADVVIGGPPCQPFSRFGLQKSKADSRDGFPHFLRAVKEISPRAFLFENVRNQIDRHGAYLNGILDSLRSLGYFVEARVLNAVHYGVPQCRERLFVVGYRSRFAFPRQCRELYTVQEALWDTIDTVSESAHFLTPAQDAYIARYERASSCVTPRDLHRDRLARTLTCRNLAGATSDMHRIRLADGRRRRITCREAARLQSFPDWYSFEGSETERFNQIGNAVPPLLAYHLAMSVRASLEQADRGREGCGGEG